MIRIFLLSSLQGMYYSYYKTIAESKDFFDGMQKLSHDNLSEYGNVIDATKKYNLLPEVGASLPLNCRLFSCDTASSPVSFCHD